MVHFLKRVETKFIAKYKFEDFHHKRIVLLCIGLVRNGNKDF